MHYKNVILSKYMLMKYFHFYPGDGAKHCHFFFSSPASPLHSCLLIPLFEHLCFCFPMTTAAGSSSYFTES